MHHPTRHAAVAAILRSALISEAATLAEVADFTGTTRQHLRDIAARRNNPSAKLTAKLLAMFGLREQDLYPTAEDQPLPLAA